MYEILRTSSHAASVYSLEPIVALASIGSFALPVFCAWHVCASLNYPLGLKFLCVRNDAQWLVAVVNHKPDRADGFVGLQRDRHIGLWPWGSSLLFE
jgi:hypothetical protein